MSSFYCKWFRAYCSLLVLHKKVRNLVLPTLIQELIGLFDQMSEKDQKKLGEKLKYYADLHTAVPDKDKILQLDIK